jgi:Ino eighty subunit 2
VAPTIKVSRPGQAKSASTAKTKTNAKYKPVISAKDSDDDELSELESEDDEIQDTVKVGGGGDDDDDDEEDAEGEEDDEIEATGAAADDDDEELDSSDETPDLTKMTKRQRARFEDGDGGLLKLSDGKPAML